MKSYVKPTIDYFKLTVEERFALGSGTACVETGACGYVDSKGTKHTFEFWVGLNG